MQGDYEDELKDKFMKFHDMIQECATNNFRNFGNLTRQLTIRMAEGMRTLNPPCKEEISFRNSFINDYDDVESVVNDYTIKKRNKNSILSRFVNEIELT
jgi:hypothetical protein